MEVYADETAHGVPFETYGYTKWETDPWGFIPKINQHISIWHKKNDGRRMREALCEKLDYALVGDDSHDHGTNAVQYPHPNILVANATAVTKVAYSTTLATYAGSVNTALGSVAHPTSLKWLDALSEQLVQNLNLEPIIDSNDEAVYGLMLPTHTCTELRSLFMTIEQYSANPLLKKLGGRRYNNFVLMEDPRSPRCKTTSSTIGFTYNGVNDGRDAAAATTVDVGFVLGREALIEYVAEEMHYEQEVQRYGRKKGIGAFQTKGYNRVEWDASSAVNAATRRNQNSALVLFKAN
jgi:hypothetical protein